MAQKRTVRVSVQLNASEVDIEINPEDLIWSTGPAQSVDEVTDEMILDAAIDEFYLHHRTAMMSVEYDLLD